MLDEYEKYVHCDNSLSLSLSLSTRPLKIFSPDLC